MRKCGFHVQATSNALRQAIASVQPTEIVSLAHDYGFWRGVQRDHPDIFLIGRKYEEDRDWRATNPRWWAEQCAALEMPYDAFITWNEPTDVYNDITMDLAARHDEWCCEFRERILDLGYQAVALNVPTGHFHRNAIVNLFPNVCQEFDYIGLHEYSARVMWDQDPKKQRPPEEVPKNEGDIIGRWYCRRYRDWHDGIVARWPEREGKFQIVVTECGVAYGVMEADYGDVGWRTDLSEQQYVDSLAWYFTEMNDDDYCLGGAIFMMGFADHKWASFETLDIWQRLLEIPEITENGGNGMDIKIYDFDHGPGDPETVDWDWVRDTFGDVQVHPIEEKITLQEGDVVYKLDYLDARIGDANIIINVRDEDGNPVQGEIVMFGWPDAPDHGYPGKPSNWTGSGVPGDTNANGDVGPGLGKGAYYCPPERGPHWIWVYGLPSDYVDGLGMLPGGCCDRQPHAHLNLGYRAVEWGDDDNDGNGDEGEFVLWDSPLFGEGNKNEVILYLTDDSERDFFETQADVFVTNQEGDEIYWESPEPTIPVSLVKYVLGTEYDPQPGETERWFHIGIRDWTTADKKIIGWIGPFHYRTGVSGTWTARVRWEGEEPSPPDDLEKRVAKLEQELPQLRADVKAAFEAAADKL